MVIKRKNHNWPKYRETHINSHTENVYTIYPFPRLRNYFLEEGAQRVHEPGTVDDYRDITGHSKATVCVDAE